MSAEAFFVRLQQSFADSTEHLNGLDAAIGDGDHGSTMLRGLTAAIAADDGRRAKAFMRASGGASGTLFGLILVGIEAHFEQFPIHEHREETIDDLSVRLAERLQTALERICDLGEVKPGDKSMVDALAPAVAALKAEGLGSASVLPPTGAMQLKTWLHDADVRSTLRPVAKGISIQGLCRWSCFCRL